MPEEQIPKTTRELAQAYAKQRKEIRILTAKVKKQENIIAFVRTQLLVLLNRAGKVPSFPAREIAVEMKNILNKMSR